MAKFFKLLIFVPLGLLILAFAIANRQTTTVSFDPFSSPNASTAIVPAPLFILLFCALLLGILLGGVATWVSQGTNRREARRARDEAEQWRDEVRRMREQPPLVTPAPGRALVSSRG